MNSHRFHAFLILLGVVLGVLVSRLLPVPGAAQTSGKPAASAGQDNAEIARLYRDDQADRSPPAGKSIDWAAVAPRDKARLARVKELYAQDRLRTGADYYHAAMILQHGGAPEAYLLAHELCVVSLSKGEARAKWLAAASEDRFLVGIGRPQRFGTQYSGSGPDGPFRLDEVGEGVTDALRRELDVPSLAEAKAREAELNKK